MTNEEILKTEHGRLSALVAELLRVADQRGGLSAADIRGLLAGGEPSYQPPGHDTSGAIDESPQP